jgi:hypothetical protein
VRHPPPLERGKTVPLEMSQCDPTIEKVSHKVKAFLEGQLARSGPPLSTGGDSSTSRLFGTLISVRGSTKRCLLVSQGRFDPGAENP